MNTKVNIIESLVPKEWKKTTSYSRYGIANTKENPCVCAYITPEGAAVALHNFGPFEAIALKEYEEDAPQMIGEQTGIKKVYTKRMDSLKRPVLVSILTLINGGDMKTVQIFTEIEKETYLFTTAYNLKKDEDFASSNIFKQIYEIIEKA